MVQALPRTRTDVGAAVVHDVANFSTCECGEPGCGSYRPLPGLLSIREQIARSEEMILSKSARAKLPGLPDPDATDGNPESTET